MMFWIFLKTVLYHRQFGKHKNTMSHFCQFASLICFIPISTNTHRLIFISRNKNSVNYRNQNPRSAENYKKRGFLPSSSKINLIRGFSGSPVVETLPSTEEGSIPGQCAKNPYALGPKRQNMKQKQHCNKFNEDLKKWSSLKNKKFL